MTHVLSNYKKKNFSFMLNIVFVYSCFLQYFISNNDHQCLWKKFNCIFNLFFENEVNDGQISRDVHDLYP